MTLPDERYRAIKYTEQFLTDLLDPKKTPRVPKDIRQRAYSCLRHYPGGYYLDVLATRSPSILETPNPIDDVSMLIHDYEVKKQRNNQC
jgi:hypothetical protein